MKRHCFFHIISGLLLVTSAKAQQPLMPDRIYSFDPIPVHRPVMLDSTNLDKSTFSDEKLLAYPVSFPAQERFTKELTPDTAGFFNLTKPQQGKALQLFSFFVTGDRYGKGKLTITSPNPLELWVDNVKRATKTQVNDSLHQSGSVDTNLNGPANNMRIIIKMLTSAEYKADPALKIELKPDEKDSLLVYTFNNIDNRRINIKDIVEGKRVNGSSISPSGRFVLLNLRETLSGGNSRSYTEIYDAKQKRMILSEPGVRAQLNWMPKSDLLYFVTDDNGRRTLYRLDPLTAETEIMAEGLPKENFHMAPDERSVFFSTKESITISNPGGLKRLLGIDDRLPGYRDRYFLYRYFFDTGLTQQLTFGRQTASLNDVTDDVKKLLFSTSEEYLQERPFRRSSLYMLDLETMEVDTIWKNERYAYSAQFSPDGKQLLIHGAPEAFGGIGLHIKEGQIANSYDTQSFIMNLATRQVEPVSKNFDPAIHAQEWNAHDGYIYYRVEEGDRANMYRYDPRRKKFDKLPLKEDVIRSFNIAENTAWATYTGVSTSNSNRSYLLNLKTMESTLISDPYAERLNKLQLGEVKDWQFTSSFGDVIEGRYYLPPHFDPKKKYPLIVYYYGGTSPTSRTFESTYPLHVYAAQDYVVYTLQPSGTTGYGQEFSARHVNAWGDRTAEEIIEGTKAFVASHPFVDGTKIGNIGASYGGFMTQYLITRTDLFSASVSHAGISSITSYWGEGYWGYSYSAGASAGSYPWNNPDLYVKQSPLFSADKINTPLLLLHGTADTNVPIGESIQMYNALKLLGKEVEFIQVEGENHAIYDYDKRIAWNNAIYAWFAKWLKDDSRWWDSMFPND
ncbi:S9 family peptidase [Proteiniphilum sp. X52]|uniref:S9 family peptidase n=1 Tax=Proteiniphilum sp. X52 TaxID=2382159 RepID=UPI000F0A1222|nr:S9 family peptidase [Proteiniphilum sp. X52]RNC64614.1 S9 family peptidase [Proteiniphilum sp. X52]